MYVLILEDEPKLGHVFEKMIASFNPQAVIVCCRTIREAIFQASQHQFQIALLDYHLPDGTGLDVLSYLPRTCIKLGMSGSSIPPEIRQLYTKFFLKPIQMQALKEYFAKV